MKTLLRSFLVLLALAWTCAAVAILPLAITGTILMSGKVFFWAWICAIVLIAVPALNNMIQSRKVKAIR
jgi:hypothetical protein